MEGASWGRYLAVDLASGEAKALTVPDDVQETFLGGSAVAAWLLASRPGDGPLILSAGLLAGTCAPGASRLTVCGRSPLTGLLGESCVGGHFATEVKTAGWDGILLEGRASKPSVLVVEDDRAFLDPADGLWGLDTFEAHERLLQRYGDVEACVIGPAGEKACAIASILFGGREARAAGRGGMGAVLGAKNVKAIALRGTVGLPVADPEGFLESVARTGGAWYEKMKAFGRLGTTGGVLFFHDYGDMPVRNFTRGHWPDGAARTSGQAFEEKGWFVRSSSCAACGVGCGKWVGVAEGEASVAPAHGPEYETLAAFGANVLNEDPASIAKANELCNRLGLDTISTAAGIAFLVEAGEKGLLPHRMDGQEWPAWERAGTWLHVIEEAACRRGAGALIADGTRRAARQLGPDAAGLVLTVKGMEFPMHDPRAFASMACNYATANRGACHLEALSYYLGLGVGLPELGYTEAQERHDDTAAPRQAVDMQNFQACFNALGLCKFTFRGGDTTPLMAEWARLATGWPVTADTLIETGERAFNLKRLLNLRWGATAADDRLPDRFLQALPDGEAKGYTPDLDGMIARYYALRGWDPEGRPTAATLERLSLTPLDGDGA